MTQNNIPKIVYIPQELTVKTVIEVLAKFDSFINSSANNIVISFSHTTFTTPSGLTILLCYLRDLPKIKKNFHGVIVHSNDENTDKLIARMGFYNLLGLSDDFDWNKDEVELFKELYCFNCKTPESEIIKINEKIIYSFTKLSNNNNYRNAVNWCIPELVDNARTHSNAEECILFAQKISRGNYTEFCIADRGLGIRNTMGDLDIVSALKRCISQEKGVNSKGMGNGLYFTSQLIKNDNPESNSSLTIFSENAILEITSGNEPEILKTNSFWNGTAVMLTLSDTIQSSIEDIKGSEVSSTEDLPDFFY